MSEKTLILKRSHGDMRSLLNLSQSTGAQYMTDRDQISEIDIGSAITAFFAETNLENAKNILARSDYHYIDLRARLSPEDRRRDILYAFYTSIISSRTLDKEYEGQPSCNFILD